MSTSDIQVQTWYDNSTQFGMKWVGIRDYRPIQNHNTHWKIKSMSINYRNWMLLICSATSGARPCYLPGQLCSYAYWIWLYDLEAHKKLGQAGSWKAPFDISSSTHGCASVVPWRSPQQATPPWKTNKEPDSWGQHCPRPTSLCGEEGRHEHSGLNVQLHGFSWNDLPIYHFVWVSWPTLATT